MKDAITAIITCYRSGGKLLICGNGGSAADADHIVGELAKGFKLKRPTNSRLSGLQGGLPAVSLSAHTALMTAIINDLGADLMYAQQVQAFGQKGDILIGISTSGNAENVRNAFIVAKEKDMKTILFTGRTGGKCREFADIVLCVPSEDTAFIQERHIEMYHQICADAEAEFWKL